ncbi:hypothetical protein VTO42DRAFT_5297 [Malbranchea cinnamomea]
MPAYHSVFLQETNVPLIGNFPLLPLRTRTRGPAYTLPPLPPNVDATALDPNDEAYDIVDEALALFRANTLFRNFEIRGPADRALIYATLFIADCLSRLAAAARPTPPVARDAEKILLNAALLDSFAIPGDPAFPLNQAFEPPRDAREAETLRAYLSQLRQEVALRLVARVYAGGDTPSKWWLSFARRKFMGKSL